MAVWEANRVQKHVSRVWERFTWGPRVPTGRGSVLQWAIVGILGIVLGVYTIGVSSLPSQWVPLLLLAVLFPFVAMMVGNVRKLLLAIIILDIPFQLDTHLFYRTEVADLGAIGGLDISVTTVSLVVLYTLWLGGGVIRREHRWRPLFGASLPLAVYLAFAVVSLVVARDITLSFFGIFLLLQTFLLFIYVVGTVETREDVVFIVALLLLSLLVQSLVVIGTYLTGQELSFAGISTRVNPSYTTGQFFRPGGTIGSPVTAASYLSLLLAPAISVWLTHLGRSYKLLATLAFGFGVVALIVTFTRGGWINFAASLVFLYSVAWYRGWVRLLVPLTIFVLVVVLSLPFYDAIQTRLFGYDVGAAYSRIPLMKLALRIIEDHPVLGIGANNFAVAMMQYARIGFSKAWLYTVHNKYLLVWAETGIGGLVAFVWFLLSTVRQGWQTWQASDRLLSSLALGFTAAVIGQMVHMNVDLFNARPQVQLLWLICGLIMAMRNMGVETSRCA